MTPDFKRGIELGLEAAARLADIRGEEWEKGAPGEDGDLLCAIAFYRYAKEVSSLDPVTIAYNHTTGV